MTELEGCPWLVVFGVAALVTRQSVEKASRLRMRRPSRSFARVSEDDPDATYASAPVSRTPPHAYPWYRPYRRCAYAQSCDMVSCGLTGWEGRVWLVEALVLRGRSPPCAARRTRHLRRGSRGQIHLMLRPPTSPSLLEEVTGAVRVKAVDYDVPRLPCRTLDAHERDALENVGGGAREHIMSSRDGEGAASGVADEQWYCAPGRTSTYRANVMF